jgi:hypothetical protein
MILLVRKMFCDYHLMLQKYVNFICGLVTDFFSSLCVCMCVFVYRYELVGDIHDDKFFVLYKH